MNIYFLRHGIAAEKPAWKGPDSDRPLIKEGITKMKKAVKGMRRLKLNFDWILTSPYRRAFETAQIVAKEFKAKGKLKVLKSLAVDGDPQALVRHLARDYRSWESVLLVGHEPYLSHLIGVLEGSPALSMNFQKGGLCLLSSDSLTYGSCATLEWLLTPKILKKLT
jgi:phosphohistidine phosphatase